MGFNRYAPLSSVLSKERFVELYLQQGNSLNQIALLLNTTPSTLGRLAKQYELTLRSNSESKLIKFRLGWRPPPKGHHPTHTTDGYICIPISSNDFFFPMAHVAAHRGRENSNWAYIPEHRLVMARSLGRILQTWEAVHHKNGNKADNRLENLSLLMTGQHNGKVKCPHCHQEFAIR